MRKADRLAIAAAFHAVADKFGASVTQREEPPNPGYHGHSIYMRFALNGIGAQVSIDNLHGGDGALISWFNDSYPARNFTRSFETAVGSQGSARTHHKASSVGTWELLAARLQAGLRHASHNTALEN